MLDVMDEMLRLHRALPARPSLEEVEAAEAHIQKVDMALAECLNYRHHEQMGDGSDPNGSWAAVAIPELVGILRCMRKESLEESAHQEKLQAQALLHLEQRHRCYDAWIQKAHRALAPHFPGKFEVPQQLPTVATVPRPHTSLSVIARSLLRTSAPRHEPSPPEVADHLACAMGHQRMPPLTDTSVLTPLEGYVSVQPSTDVAFKGRDSLQVSSLLDVAFKNGLKSLDLQGFVRREIEWIPESLGSLTWLTQLNLSSNRLAVLPNSIVNLTNLTRLDVSSNQLVSLPEAIGEMASLEILNIKNNKVEDLPCTIGQCSSLVALKADFNKLKALPEAVGSLVKLTSLSVHLNCLKGLPTTMATMKSLIELDVHFNQLEFVPESLCLVTTIAYLNVASNFTDLKELPPSIGRLQNLKHLDASFNHLTVLPDSFTMLTNLQTLKLEGNPLRVPPLHTAEQGKEAVLSYMTEYVAQKERDLMRRRKKGLLAKSGSKTFGIFKRFKQRGQSRP